MKKSLFKLFILALTLCFFSQVQGQRVSKQTYVYAVKGADTLRLDKYATVVNKTDTTAKPVVMFAFGGGFKGGTRSNKDYLPYFMALVRNGFTVISIDYRTTLKNVQPTELTTIEGFANALSNAVSAAVEDYVTATSFIIKQSKAWKVDPQKIVACGSSAGAITVLQSEYMICNGNTFDGLLPTDFNYAGVVSFAGAIMSIGEPSWHKQPCPIMFFHGDADSMVPFKKVAVNGAGLYGSDFIVGQLKEQSWPYYFYKVEGAGHEIASRPMHENINDVLSFLSQMVIGQSKYAINTTRAVPGLIGYKTDFTLEDYIKENMK